MNHRRWNIVFLRTDEKDPVGHPAVILSSDDTMADDKQQRFNVVTGTKKQPGESARNHHVILDEADGMEFLTLVDCSLVVGGTLFFSGRMRRTPLDIRL